MKMNWTNVKKFSKGAICVILVFIFMSSCFVKSKFDNPTDGVGGLLLEGVSLLYAVSEGNITVSGILKDSNGSIIASGILDITRSGSASILNRASADSRVYSDANGKFSMNIYQGSFTIKVSRSDGSSVGSFSIKVSSATATPEVLSSTGLQVSGLTAAPVGTSGGGTDPIISVSNTPSSIEEGTSASIGIKLAGNITQSYTISITSSNPSAISVSPSTLTFTSSNFSIDQQLTLSALQDENIINESVVINLSSTGLSKVDLSINTIDDDTQNIIISGITEVNEGTSGSITVKLSKDPSTNVIVNLTSSVSTSLSIGNSSLLFTSLNYSIPQTVTINGLQDSNQTSETVIISATSSGITTANWNIVCIEDDTTIVFGSPENYYENGENKIPITLSGNPGKQRTVLFSVSSLTISLSSTSLDFTPSNYSTPQYLIVSGLSDSYQGDIVLTASGSGIVTNNYTIPIYPKYIIGGNVSGLSENLVLTNKNNYDNKLITQNGNFTFPKSASFYSVSAKYYLLGKICLFINTIGVSSSIVNNININCTNLTYTLGAAGPGLLSTGQITSYSFGDDGYYQNTLKRSYTDNENGTITDNVTGLIYQKCSAGQGTTIGDCNTGIATTYIWSDAKAYCQSLNLAGKNWRLPNVNELVNLVDYSKSNTFIDTNIFPNTKPQSYWSLTTLPQDISSAWIVLFDYGYLLFSYNTNNYYVRCVSNDAETTKTFSDNNDGTVIDNSTKLIWQKCSAGQGTSTGNCNTGSIIGYSWLNAISYCENLNLGNRSDWRLPNINELRSIVDYSSFQSPSIDTNIFPITQSNDYWSSSSASTENGRAWFISFDGGYTDYGNKTSNSYIRCVSGP